jgi:hypothetical protein
MNRLARVSGLAVSALTAATATILLLLPGRAQLQYPEATVSTSGGAVVTSGATVPGGHGPHSVASASEHVQRLTVSGTGSPSRLSSAGGKPAGQRSTRRHHAELASSPRPAAPSLPPPSPVVTHCPAPPPPWTIPGPATGSQR